MEREKEHKPRKGQTLNGKSHKNDALEKQNKVVDLKKRASAKVKLSRKLRFTLLKAEEQIIFSAECQTELRNDCSLFFLLSCASLSLINCLTKSKSMRNCAYLRIIFFSFFFVEMNSQTGFQFGFPPFAFDRTVLISRNFQAHTFLIG